MKTRAASILLSLVAFISRAGAQVFTPTGEDASLNSASGGIERYALVPLAYKEAVKALVQESTGTSSPLKPELITGFDADISFGSLTGVGKVAVAKTRCHVGGEASTYNPSMVLLFHLENGEPKLLALAKGGDRAHDGIESAYVSDEGALIVNRYKPTAKDCNACYGSIEETSYKIDAGKLVSIHVATKPLKDNSSVVAPNPAGSSKDQELSKLLVGTWKGGRHTTVYRADGTYFLDPEQPGKPRIMHWRIENGSLIQEKMPPLSIISITDTQFTSTSAFGKFTEVRIAEPTPNP